MKLLTTIKKEHFKKLKEFLVESGFYEEGEKSYPILISEDRTFSFIKDSLKKASLYNKDLLDFNTEIESRVLKVGLEDDGYVVNEEIFQSLYEEAKKRDSALDSLRLAGAFLDYYFIRDYLQFSFAWRLRHDDVNTYEDSGFFLKELLDSFGLKSEHTRNPRISKVDMGCYSVYYSESEGERFIHATFVNVETNSNAYVIANSRLLAKFAEALCNSQKNTNPWIAKKSLARVPEGDLVKFLLKFDRVRKGDGERFRVDAYEKISYYELLPYLIFCSKVLYNENLFSDILPFKFTNGFRYDIKEHYIQTNSFYLTVDSVYVLIESINFLYNAQMRGMRFNAVYDKAWCHARGSGLKNKIRNFETKENAVEVLNNEYYLEVKDGDYNSLVLYCKDPDSGKLYYTSAIDRLIKDSLYSTPKYQAFPEFVNPQILWGLDVNDKNKAFPRVIYTSYFRLPSLNKNQKIVNSEKEENQEGHVYRTYEDQWGWMHSRR